MKLLVNNKWCGMVKAIRWEGRACIIHVRAGWSDSPARLDSAIIFAHFSHDDPFSDIWDVTQLARGRPRNSDCMLMGDLNIDYLSQFADDPWAHLRADSAHHEFRRHVFQELAVEMGWSLQNITHVVGGPPPPWAEGALVAPVSRVPVGDQIGAPTLIDTIWARPALGAKQREVVLNWSAAPADHAVISTPLASARFASRRPRRLQWRPASPATVAADIAALIPADFADLRAFNAWVVKAQEETACQSTRAVRRRLREPWFVKLLRRRRAQARTAREAAAIGRQIHQQRRKFYKMLRQQRALQRVWQGGVVERSRRLWDTTVLRSGGRDVYDEATLAHLAAQTFAEKWSDENADNLAEISTFLEETAGQEIQFDDSAIIEALEAQRRPARTDTMGVNGNFLITAVAAGALAPLARMLRALWRDQAGMSQFCVEGFTKAKSLGPIPPEKLRAILPPPWLLRILHYIVVSQLEPFVKRECPQEPHVYLSGGTKGTQTGDIAFSFFLAVEKGLDRGSQIGIAQCDLKQYFDFVPIGRVSQHMVRHMGVPLGLARAALLLHIGPRIVLCVGAAACELPARTRGVTTGSASAALISRIPIEAVARRRSHIWKLHGFALEDGAGVFSFGNWADNAFSMGPDPSSATKILDDFSDEMVRVWGLHMGEDSREVLIVRGAHEPTQAMLQRGWQPKSVMKVLGHMVGSDGSCECDFADAIASMWKGFWGNFGNQALARGHVETKLRLLDRAVKSRFSHRCAFWPWTPARAKRLDKVQTKMIAKFVQVVPDPGESTREYHKRRALKAAAVARVAGRWSKTWAVHIKKWDDHLSRHPNSWGARLLKFRGSAWLAARRVQQPGAGAHTSRAGRTATRAVRGPVHIRWETGRDDLFRVTTF